VEKRFAHALPLPSRLELVPEDVDSDVRVVEVDQPGLCCVFVAAIAAAAAMATSGGYEVELLIGQFDRVSKIGNVLHVGLLLIKWRDIDATAATSSLVARRQSGCTVAQIFCAALRSARFHSRLSFYCHANPESGCQVERCQHSHRLNALDRRLSSDRSTKHVLIVSLYWLVRIKKRTTKRSESALARCRA
jgi:hypothetical protein